MRLLSVIALLFCFQAGAQISVTSIVATDACPAQCDGTLTINVSNATGAVSYDIGFGPQSSNVFTGLCAGTYNVVVTDALPSTAMQTAIVNTLVPVNFSVFANNESAFGACDGSAFLNISGGVPPYNAIWYDASFNIIQSGASTALMPLCSGIYFVEVFDASGCPGMGSNLQNFTITFNPSPLYVDVTGTTNSDCANPCNGTITLAGTGGNPPYAFSIDGTNWQSSNVFTNVCAGTYTAMISDNLGMVSTSTINGNTAVITSPSPLATTISNTVDATCNGTCTGQVVWFTTGGQPPYFVINPTNGNTETYSSVHFLYGLCTGTYTLYITDALGCSHYQIFTIYEPAPVASANSVTNESSPGACDGGIAMNATGGTAPYEYSMDGGTTYQSANTFTGLCNGSYTVCVMDANGCETCYTETVSSAGCTLSTSVINQTNVDCSGNCNGYVMVTTTGGTPMFTATGSFTGSPATYSSVGTLLGFCTGTHTITITDNAGCSEVITVIISEPAPLNITASEISDPTAVGNCDGEATASATGGSPAYTIYWIDCSVTSNIVWTSPGIAFLCEGDYAAVVTDANGCMDTSACVTMQVTGTGIDNTTDNHFSIYPNPAQDVLMIDNNTSEMYKINIFDLDGRLVNVPYSTYGQSRIDLTPFNNGIYHLQLITDKNIIHKTIVVNR